jgi:RHS repeat-associated protein
MRKSILLFAYFLITSIAVQAQLNVDPTLERGLKPYGSFEGGAIDSISVVNGSLNLHIPLVSYPQRGGKLHVGFHVDYTTNSYVHTPSTITECTTPPRDCVYGDEYNGSGLKIVNDFDLKLWTAAAMPPPGGGSWATVVTPDGAQHEMGPTTTGTRSIDATGYLCLNNCATLVDRDGIKYTFSFGLTAQITDPNGNFITNVHGSTGGTTSYTDTMGRSIAVPFQATGGSGPTTDFTGCTGPLPTVSAYAWVVPGYQGNVTYKFCRATINISNYTCVKQGGAPSCSYIVLQQTPIQSIVLPNNTAWTFQYDGDDPNNPVGKGGNLLQITFPTGGYIKYSWNYNYFCQSPTTTSTTTYSAVVASRTVNANDGTGDHTWTYSAPISGGNHTYPPTNTVTDPLNQQTIHTLSAVGAMCSFYETQTQFKDASGNLLKTVTTDYTGTADPMGLPPVKTAGNVVQIRVTTTWPNGNISKVETDYDAGVAMTGVQSGFTLVYGVPVAKREYDFPAGTTLLRTTATSYVWQSSNPNSASYLNNNLLSVPYSVQVKDSAGTQRAYTFYGHDESGLQTSGVIQHKSPGESFPANQTSEHRWLSAGAVTSTTNCNVSVPIGGYVVSNFVFFDTGEVQKKTDPCSKATTYAYSSTYFGALPTTISNPLSQNTSFVYDFNTGVVTSTTDVNSKVTTQGYDSMARPLSVTYPDSGLTTFCYTDVGGGTCSQSGPPYEVVITKTASPSPDQISTLVLDGLGRMSQTQLNSDMPGTTYTLTTYDALGRVARRYNPTRCNPQTSNCGESTWGFTTYFYDALGRTCLVVPPGGTVPSGNACPTTQPAGTVFTTFSGRATQVSDEGNGTRSVTRVSQVDGLGRLVSVCEVSSVPQLGAGGAPAACGQAIAQTGFLTSYSYDSLGNLVTVNQGTLGSRTFSYNSLSQLLCAANPETGSATCPNPDTGAYTAGTTRYGYDADGNVTSRIRPAPNQFNGALSVTSTYQYDSLNRIIQKSYSDGTTPNVRFGYDQPSVTMGGEAFNITNSIGRLSWECTQSSTTCTSGAATMNAFSYDPMGRTAQLWDCQHINCPLPHIVFSYDYDLLGNEMDYFVGEGPHGSVEYVSAYNGAGRLSSFTNPTFVDATNPANLLTGVQYDPLGHVISGNLANGLAISSAYDGRSRVTAMAVGTTCANGNCTTNKYRYTVAYSGDGDVTSSTDTVNGNWTYVYDDLNRISSAVGNNGQGCSWDYDRYGNRWHQNTHSGSCPAPQYSFNGNGNRIDGFSYDAAGNLLSDGTHNYSYDAENRIISVNPGPTTYVYDAEGRRFSKTTGGVATETIYDRIGNPRYRGNFGPSEIFVAEMHVGTYNINSAHTDTVFNYDFSDWLGTERARINLSASVCETIASLPFGDNQTITGTCPDLSPLHFTGKERDTESNLDMFGARYYGSSLGRFMTPDWAAKPTAVPYAQYGDPQSLNLYSYVRNNPTSVGDPDGHCLEDACVVEAAIGTAMVVSYLSSPPGQQMLRNAVNDVASVGNAVGNALSGLFHPSNGGQSASPPSTTATIVPQGTPGTMATTVSQGAPASTSQEGSVSNDPITSLPKAPTGPGSVPPDQRDPQRLATPGEKADKLAGQQGACANCGAQIKPGEGIGHHPVRHADGGRTKDVVVVCRECHKDLHSSSK